MASMVSRTASASGEQGTGIHTGIVKQFSDILAQFPGVYTQFFEGHIELLFPFNALGRDKIVGMNLVYADDLGGRVVISDPLGAPEKSLLPSLETRVGLPQEVFC